MHSYIYRIYIYDTPRYTNNTNYLLGLSYKSLSSHIHIYIYIHIHTCRYIYIYTYTYIYTLIPIHIHNTHIQDTQIHIKYKPSAQPVAQEPQQFHQQPAVQATSHVDTKLRVRFQTPHLKWPDFAHVLSENFQLCGARLFLPLQAALSTASLNTYKSAIVI